MFNFDKIRVNKIQDDTPFLWNDNSVFNGEYYGFNHVFRFGFLNNGSPVFFNGTITYKKGIGNLGA